MHHIIYCVLLIAIWLCSTASVIWVLNFGGLNWMLVAGGCVASFISSVALVEEFVEWHRHSEASPVQRELLPPASGQRAANAQVADRHEETDRERAARLAALEWFT